jgi:hypothetical protein
MIPSSSSEIAGACDDAYSSQPIARLDRLR